jgi:hypothetical protein
VPVKKIPNPEIGKVACPSCGVSVPIRINLNGCAYIFCNHKFEDGERCYHRENYGRKKSKELIERFCATLPTETENNQPEQAKIGVENNVRLQEDKNQSSGTTTNGTDGGLRAGRGGFPDGTKPKSFLGTILDNLD